MRRVVGIQSFDTTITTVASSATPVKLVGTDAARHLVSIFNDSTAILSVLMAGQAADPAALMTAGRKAVDVAAGGYYEIPENYVGDVWGKWVTANGKAEITEYR